MLVYTGIPFDSVDHQNTRVACNKISALHSQLKSRNESRLTICNSMAENGTFPAWPELEVAKNTSALQLGTQWNIKIGFVLMSSVRTIIYSFRLSSKLSASRYTHANIVSIIGAVHWFPFRNTPHESCFLYRTLSRISPSSLIYKSRNLSCAQKCNKNAKEACVLHISNAAR